ncbi:MAG: ATP-binding cassette domain-containing protein, partial [Pseudomonadota bacterium]
MSSVISCRNVWKLFGASPETYLKGIAPDTSAEEILAAGYVPAVRDVSLDISRGEMLVVMGLSGSGKSTLVRCMSRLVEITGGSVEID